MNIQDDINGYLQHRAQRIVKQQSLPEQRLDHLIKSIDTTTQPIPEFCVDGRAHEFKFVSHVDTMREAVYYHRCSKCQVLTMSSSSHKVVPIK